MASFTARWLILVTWQSKLYWPMFSSFLTVRNDNLALLMWPKPPVPELLYCPVMVIASWMATVIVKRAALWLCTFWLPVWERYMQIPTECFGTTYICLINSFVSAIYILCILNVLLKLCVSCTEYNSHHECLFCPTHTHNASKRKHAWKGWNTLLNNVLPAYFTEHNRNTQYKC